MRLIICILDGSWLKTLNNMGSLRDAPERGLPFDLICAVTLGVHYLGRALVQCTQAVKKCLPFDLIYVQ